MIVLRKYSEQNTVTDLMDGVRKRNDVQVPGLG